MLAPHVELALRNCLYWPSVSPVSLISVSMSARSPCLVPLTTPNLLWSASSTRVEAQPSISRLTAASAGSGVVRPRSIEMPLVPRNATSTLISASARAAESPTSAKVTLRSRPPSVKTVSRGRVSSDIASGTVLV